MGEIIARFADGRLLVQEERVITNDYTSGTGVAVRIGLVKTVEKVLSIDAYVSGYSECRLGVPLNEVAISGDTLLVRMRRQDILSSFCSGTLLEAGTRLSAITSGLVWNIELSSGVAQISGVVNVLANVIGL